MVAGRDFYFCGVGVGVGVVGSRRFLAYRQCLKCHRRISKLVYDRHNFCTKCRCFECSLDSRCDECVDWSRDEMEAYIKHRRSLKAKDIKVKDPLSRPPSPSDAPVPSAQLLTATSDDVDRRIARFGQELSTSFTGQFNDISSFLRTSFNQLSQDITAKIASNHASFAAPPEVSVADWTLSHQPSPLPPVATVGQHREFQVQGGVDWEPLMTTHPLPSGESIARGSMLGEQVQISPGHLEFSAPTSGSAQRQVTFDLASSRVGSKEVEDDDNDADSVTASAADHSYVRLSKFIYDHYPESRPLSSPSLPPRCGFESLFAPTDPPESSRPHFRLYPRVEEVMTATRELAAALSRKLKPLSAVRPKKNQNHSVADVPDFATALPVNPDFSHLTDNKTVFSKHWGSITFLGMDLMECVSSRYWRGFHSPSG